MSTFPNKAINVIREVIKNEELDKEIYQNRKRGGIL